MAQKIILFFLLSFGLPLMAPLEAQESFQKTFGNTNGNEANSVILTNSGGYGIAGWYDVEGLFTAEFYLILTDAAGDTLLTRTYGAKTDSTVNFLNGSGNEGYHLLQTSDNGFLFVGERHLIAGEQSDAFVVRIDPEGELLWAKTYGGLDNDYGLSAIETADGDFVIGGFTESYGAGIRDMYLFKIDNTGEVLWNRTYGGSSIDAAFDMQQTNDGGFILAGYTFSFSGSSDIYVIRTDADGAVLWQKTYGGALNDIGHSILQTADDGFIICGETESFGLGSSDVYLIKINMAGEVQWSKTYGGSQYEAGKSIALSNDGGYVLAGYSRSFGSGGEDFYMIKTDGSGDLVWTKIFGGDFDEAAQSIKKTADQGFIMTGYSKSFGTGFSDVYLVKTDSLGNSGCDQGPTDTQVNQVATIESAVNSVVDQGMSVAEPTTRVGYTATGLSDPCDIINSTERIHEKVTFRVYPNPADEYLTLETLNRDNNAFSQVVIYDVLGRVVYSGGRSHDLTEVARTGERTVNISGLPAGVFILRVMLNDGGEGAFTFLKR